VTLTKQGAIAVVALNNPPVNALSHAARVGINQAFATALADPDIAALVLLCEGRTFVAGADIREFGKPPLAPDLPELVEFVGAAHKPIIVALHGTALGGGLELALACDFRIAVPSAKLGLPEVTLGLLPGAGGTQRLPRLIGARAALDMITGGGLISAAQALSLGLVDEVVDGELKTAALAYADRVLAERRPLRKISERRLDVDDAGLFEAYERRVAEERRGFLAPLYCVKAVRAAAELPFIEGIARERELFRELMASTQSKAQRHAFFAERDVQKPPQLPDNVEARAVKNAAVVADGGAGGDIAACFAGARIPVTLVGTSQPALDVALQAAREHFARVTAAGTLGQGDADQRLASIRTSLSLGDVGDADLVVEAVLDDLALEREVFPSLDVACKRGAILATASSWLDVDEIAATTQRPGEIVGMHFFTPASALRGLENARGRRTLPDVCATVTKLGRTLGKVPVLVDAHPGLVGDRMFEHLLGEALRLLEEGARHEDIDRVLHDFGFPTGLLAALGRTGFQAEALSRGPGMTPTNERSTVREIVRRSLDDREILERCLYAAVNEGARILEQGIAPRPLEIDMVWIHGLGFPVYRGGPMFWADEVGLARVYQGMLGYRERSFDENLAPAPLLERLATTGKGFYG
jgi:3-hydroxyacyl-CoA dehydrogenase